MAGDREKERKLQSRKGQRLKITFFYSYGMRLAVSILRCEVVAAFTNPTLHRIISQHLFFRRTAAIFFGMPLRVRERPPSPYEPVKCDSLREGP
jgi:hypothetical protein